MNKRISGVVWRTPIRRSSCWGPRIFVIRALFEFFLRDLRFDHFFLKIWMEIADFVIFCRPCRIHLIGSSRRHSEGLNIPKVLDFYPWTILQFALSCARRYCANGDSSHRVVSSTLRRSEYSESAWFLLPWTILQFALSCVCARR